MDQEIKAMGALAEALAPLQPEEVRRVLRWAGEKFLPREASKFSGSEPAPIPTIGSSSYGMVADLFDAASPKTGLQKILVAGYWFQICQSMTDFDSQSLNTELKNLGYPSKNITRDMDSLANRTPKLILQTRKDGTSQQARKKFKLTREGLRIVERLLAGEQGIED